MLPHDETGVTGTEEEATRGEVAMCGLSLLEANLARLAQVVSAGFLHCLLTPTPNAVLYRSPSTAHPLRWDFKLCPLHGHIYINYFEFFCRGDLSLLTCSLMCTRRASGYLLYAPGSNLKLLAHFVAQMIPALGTSGALAPC